ncbi:hypothetical protein [Chitinophaga silvisoli]|uniref:Uncharacterized protein n=1 Tax=Chitinophaga silvisoli TaxID=2291814 RepID=A0A3E1NN46_9BACT|nr:hypothetical protein [Chitinophaga silvisoli]RFM29365.1 hypothetical protein DXN04_32945 [Chitinophaga silvisoli]
MSTSQNNNPSGLKAQPGTEKVVIQDECGDSMWEEVLAQTPDLTTIISKQITTGSDQAPASENGEPSNNK